VHAGTQTQAPASVQTFWSGHVPQVPPHPSVPHTRPAQAGTQQSPKQESIVSGAYSRSHLATHQPSPQYPQSTGQVA